MKIRRWENVMKERNGESRNENGIGQIIIVKGWDEGEERGEGR